MAQRQFASGDTSIWLDKYGDGSAGDYSTSGSIADSSRTGYANTTITGTADSTSATAGAGTGFSAGDLVLIHQSKSTGAGAWELNKISSTGTGTNWTMSYALINSYVTGAQVYRLAQFNNVTIGNGHTLTGVSWSGTAGGIVALLAKGTITVTGTISGNSIGFSGGANSSADNVVGWTGLGTNGTATSRSTSANSTGGGGGGANLTAPGGGGGGGHAAAGSNGTVLVGTGGDAGGTASLTTAIFGGGGAGGGRGNNSYESGAGGKSGTLIFLIGKTITVTGGITSNGENGANATGVGGTTHGGGGGGGSGGGILIKGQNISLGSTVVTATGGTGGTGISGGGNGGAGSVGRIHVDYSGSISGTTNPTLDSTQDGTLADVGGYIFIQA
jgi:hypothetical protein